MCRSWPTCKRQVCKTLIPTSGNHLRTLPYTFPKFDGLKEGQIPIFPIKIGLTISTRGKPWMKVHHRQYPLVGAYAFTDFKAQGQTIDPVMVDIGHLPGNLGMSPFSAYVALSSGRGRE